MAYTVDQNFTNHTDSVRAVDILNGNIVSASADGTVKIWDSDTGNVSTNYTDQSEIFAVHVLNNNTDIASGDNTGTINIWDSDTGNVSTNFTKHNRVRDIDQLDDGRLVSSGSSSVKIWDPDTGNVSTNFTGHSTTIWGVKVIQNDNIASASADGTVKIWDPDTGNVSTNFTGHSSFLIDVNSFDDNRILSAGGNAEAIVWDYDTGNIDTNFTEHTDTVRAAFTSFNADAVTGSEDNKVKIWDPDTGVVNTNFTEHTNNIEDIDQLDDGRLVSASLDETVKIWDAGLSGSKTLTGISLDLGSTELLIDDTTTATVTANYDDGSTEDITSDASIFSNDTNIATVSGSTVTPQGIGSTTIQADYDGETDTAPIDVVRDVVMNVVNVKNITDTQAEFVGEITEINDSNITDIELGFDWRPTGSSSWNVLKTDTVSFSNISLPYEYSDTTDQLSEGTEYEFRAYAVDVS